MEKTETLGGLYWESMHAWERGLLEWALEIAAGSYERAAQILGTSRGHVFTRCRKVGVDVDKFLPTGTDRAAADAAEKAVITPVIVASATKVIDGTKNGMKKSGAKKKVIKLVEDEEDTQSEDTPLPPPAETDEDVDDADDTGDDLEVLTSEDDFEDVDEEDEEDLEDTEEDEVETEESPNES